MAGVYRQQADVHEGAALPGAADDAAGRPAWQQGATVPRNTRRTCQGHFLTF